MRKSLVVGIALSLMLSACREETANTADGKENEKIDVTLTINDFELTRKPMMTTRTATTRSEGEMLYPVFVYVADADGEDDLTLVATLNSDTQFSFTVGNGNYELFAICGLPKEVQPKTKTDVIDIPRSVSATGGLRDFAVGEMEIAVEDGVCEPNTLNIEAGRMLAWIDLTFTDIPAGVRVVRLYAKGLYESFSLSEKWEGDINVDKHYMEIPISYDNDVCSGSALLPPSYDDTQLTVVAVVATASNQTKILAGTTDVSFAPSTHLSLDMRFGEMNVIDDEIANVGDWIPASESGTLDADLSFEVGEQYFNEAATVYYATETYLRIFPHVAEEMTREELMSMKDDNLNDYNYTLLPEIPAVSWMIPVGQDFPQAVISAIKEVGWEEFCRQFVASGNVPISKTDRNVLAYFDVVNTRFFCYDFENMKIVDVTDEDVPTFWIFPLGLISLVK